MNRIAVFIIGITALTAYSAEPVGVKVDLIAKPVSAVTVPIESVTVSEMDVSRVAYDKPSREKLISIIRGNGSEETRLCALNQVWDQDDLFFLFVKPGEDRNMAIRVAAINKLAEIELARVLAAKAEIKEVAEAMDERLKGIFPDNQNMTEGQVPHIVVEYVKRFKTRHRQ